MLDKLANAHGFTDKAQVGLELAPLHDCGLRAVGAERVPGEEAGEVLDKAECLVATH